MQKPIFSDKPLLLLSLIFFIWGLITVVSNSLIPYYKELFQLDYTMTMLFPMAFFITRVTVSLPTSFIMAKVGYKKTLKYCLYFCFVGCLSMAFFVQTQSLLPTLFGILLMASGITAIQVVSSPYVSLLAAPEKSIVRQSIATTTNSIGTILGPLVLSGVIVVATLFDVKNTGIQISILFVAIAVFFLGLIIFYNCIDIADIHTKTASSFWSGFAELFRNRSFMSLVFALMLYIGVEVSFGTFTISYLASPEYGDLGLVKATQLIAIYWGGMFIGRLGFAKYGYRLNSNRLFMSMCLISMCIAIVATQHTHVVVGFTMLGVGLCNSTLYPIIYAKALRFANKNSAQGAALLIMCSIGGALLPLAQASVIDNFSLNQSYWIPALSYLVMIGLYMTSKKSSN